MSDPGPSPLITEEIPPALAGQRVDRIVALITGCSRAEASALIGSEQVLVDGAVVSKPSIKLDEGQQVALLSEPVHPVEVVEPDPDIDVRVVFSDDDIIVIDKPAGLVVHPGPGHSGSTLVHGLLARFPELADVGEPLRPGLVHRLDRGTSGLLVVARPRRRTPSSCTSSPATRWPGSTPRWCGATWSTARVSSTRRSAVRDATRCG